MIFSSAMILARRLIITSGVPPGLVPSVISIGPLGARIAHVFAQGDGSPVQPNSLTHEFVRILAQSKTLPRIRFHDLRHSHATHLLANGVHPKIAQERLGHSSVGITLDLYSHVLPGMQADAAAKVDAALRAAIDSAAERNGSKAVANALPVPAPFP